jgi:glutamate synthase (NADPH/NADH) small chain
MMADEGTRRPLEELRDSFTELKPPLSKREAVLEANRCLYCYDAPCVKACPTDIDIPTFIKKISTDNVTGAAVTILTANLMGASCGRVCPVEELCVGACVLGADHQPIAIGRLQRYATDHLHEKGVMPFSPGETTGKKVAVVGAGPAGLTCAGELAKEGHAVTVLEKRELPGGLSTYGIVVMREPIKVALEEVEFVKKLGVEVESGVAVGRDVSAETLLSNYDAVFIATGMGSVRRLGIPGEDLDGVVEALAFIAETKLAEKEGLERLQALPVGHHVAVIGAGNTAIDAATIAKRLGAERVTMVYRRTAKEMPAYPAEYGFIKGEGAEFRFLAQPVEILGADWVTGLKCRKVKLGEVGAEGRREVVAEDDTFVLECDQVIKAIGQEPLSCYEAFGIATERGYVRVDEGLRTSNPKVFAGGDCVRLKGDKLTVTAAEDGKIAAGSIHTWLNQAAAPTG